MKAAAGTLLLLLTMAGSAAAQVRIPPEPRRGEPSVEPRVFVLGTVQQFSASDTFDAVFGGALHPFFGGGISVAFTNGLYVDGTVSFFRKTGERAFSFDGESFPLGIPLKARIVPIEFTAGYRFVRSPSSRFTPYAGGGLGAYSYKETSDFDEDGEGVDQRHVGYLLVGGTEYRVGRRLSTAFDVQFSHVPGILGESGLSAVLEEDSLGGIAFRFRLMVGR